MMPVVGISWDDSRGAAPYRIQKFWYNRENSTPLTFSKAAAEAVAEQLKTRWKMVKVEIYPVEA